MKLNTSSPLPVIRLKSDDDKQHSLLFRLATKALKYCLLMLFGFLVVCLVAAIFDVFNELAPSMQWVGQHLFRLAALTLFLMVSIVIFESLRQ